jgi:hypothetical protein
MARVIAVDEKPLIRQSDRRTLGVDVLTRVDSESIWGMSSKHPEIDRRPYFPKFNFS